MLHEPVIPTTRTSSYSQDREPTRLHLALNELNAQRLCPALPGSVSERALRAHAALLRAERELLEHARSQVAQRAAAAPTDPSAFGAWFEALRENGPGQGDPLFPFLAREATREQLTWFIRQEAAGEAGFEDLVALTQLRMPTRAKLEMARNYWDEMGRGKQVGMHGPMLAQLTNELHVTNTPAREIVWESLALANLLVGLAFHREYAFHAVGALGAIELTSTTRTGLVADGLERVGVSRRGTHYFRLHSTVDVSHFASWRTEVLEPLVAERPELARFIAEGALMRLEAGRRTFERYRRELCPHL